MINLMAFKQKAVHAVANSAINSVINDINLRETKCNAKLQQSANIDFVIMELEVWL